jgi:hypothetical protein
MGSIPGVGVSVGCILYTGKRSPLYCSTVLGRYPREGYMATELLFVNLLPISFFFLFSFGSYWPPVGLRA